MNHDHILCQVCRDPACMLTGPAPRCLYELIGMHKGLVEQKQELERKIAMLEMAISATKIKED